VKVRTHPPAQAPASRPLGRPGKIQLTIIGGNAPVVVVKLQRTDTTLDLSQKAEKGMQAASRHRLYTTRTLLVARRNDSPAARGLKLFCEVALSKAPCFIIGGAHHSGYSGLLRAQECCREIAGASSAAHAVVQFRGYLTPHAATHTGRGSQAWRVPL